MNLAAALENSEQATGQNVPAVLSLEVVKPRFDHYVKEVDKMVKSAELIVVKDEESNKLAVSFGGEVKKIAKLIEARKKEVTADASDFVKAVNGFCKIFTDKLTGIEGGLKKKISDYSAKVELERRKQEEIARKAAIELQKKIDKDAKKAGVEAPTVPAPVIPKQETVTRTETGTSAFQVKRWVCTVNDPAQVPREFCEPSTKLLNDAVKQGVRTIAGCTIEEKAETRFRT